jgi:hypothetical protein
MKRTIPVILLAVSTLFFASCKKDSSNNNGSDYYIRAKLNGEQKEFKVNVAAVKGALASNVYTLVINGNSSNEQFNIALWSDKDDFQAGKTFSIDAPAVGSYNTLAYVTPIGSADPSYMWVTTYAWDVVPETMTVTITEATSTYIKGTFSGTIYQDIETSVNSKAITEGSFSAKF